MRFLANEIVFFYKGFDGKRDENGKLIPKKINIECGIFNKNETKVKFFSNGNISEAINIKSTNKRDRVIKFSGDNAYDNGNGLGLTYMYISLAMRELKDSGWIEKHKDNKFCQLATKYKFNFNSDEIISTDDLKLCELALVNYSDIEPIKKAVEKIIEKRINDIINYLNISDEIDTIRERREF